jgi:hypothetical protein
LCVEVWDRFGAHVRELVRETNPSGGQRTVTWEVDSDAGDALESGYFMVRATVDDRSDSTLLLVTD